jgi:hypothetical protein
MEWVLLLLAGGGAGTYAGWRVREARAERRLRATELEQARQVAEEDVTVFGEQLQRLGADVGDRGLDRPTRDAYQHALDAYERAKWDAPRLRHPDQISALVDTLGSGRYAMACVRAAVEGRRPPEHRVPCFFNPQHGPSVRDVEWTPPGRGTRMFPACQRCAAQVDARERPEIRMVRIGDRRVPFWEAGSVSMPYSHGYFAGGLATGPGVSWIFDTAIAGDWDLEHYGDQRKGERGQS